MKYLLIFSLILNLWFQFGFDIFDKYVELTYCKGHGGVQSFSWEEYTIFNIELFHISHIKPPEKGSKYSTMLCWDGTDNR